MAKARYYPPDYRKEEVSAIIQFLDQGSSVSVIGPPSVGKTNMLLFMDQTRPMENEAENPWVRYAPRQLDQGQLITINIDPNALLPSLPQDKGDTAAQAWAGFELLIHRTTITPQLMPGSLLRHRPTPDAHVEAEIKRLHEHFVEAHADVTDFEDSLHAHLALRHLESIIDATLRSHELMGSSIRLAYFMDEFERVMYTMPDYFFVALRSIRDRFKYKVMFVTLTRNSLPYLAGENRMNVLEPFLELFNDSEVYMRPFNDADAWNMIEQLEKRTVSKDDYALGLLIRATGAFAGLLRAGFKHAEKLAQIQASDYSQAVTLAASRLSAELNVQAECQTLLRGLNNDEIGVMFDTSAEKPNLNQVIVRELLNKSLLVPDSRGTGQRVVPPVLAAYIRNHPTPPKSKQPAPPPSNPEP